MPKPNRATLEVALQNENNLKQTAAQIAKDIADGLYDITLLVEQLGFALTSTVVEERVNGTKLLSSTLAQLPVTVLRPQQLEFIAAFYADRLKDNHNVIPAVIDGIAALVHMTNLPRSSVPKLLQSFFQHTTCQSQLRDDRFKLYNIFKYLIEHFKSELVSMAGDFLYGLISSIDGERDPRNLDYIFSFMPHFITDYPLLHLTEDMFEIFACYFPIDFNPSKKDPEIITRDDLAVKLANCLVASPDFIESTVELAVEKLESDLVAAKLDSIELLRQASLKFPPVILEPYFIRIWEALKKEIFSGSDNVEIVQQSLMTLSTLLENAASIQEISHIYQSVILGTVLTHLSDINQRVFLPATDTALVCISGDPAFAADKILENFLLKLTSNVENSCVTDVELDAAQRIKIYTILAQVYKIVSIRCAFDKISKDISEQLQANIIACLRLTEQDNFDAGNLDIQRAALSVFNECVPIISESNRVLLYKVLMQLVTHSTIDLDFTQLIVQLGALHPIELQTNFIDVSIRNFKIFSNFVKTKIYKSLLPLVPQIAFTQRILDLIMNNVFNADMPEDVRQLALKALNMLLTQQDATFVIELQHKTNLIDKLIELTRKSRLELISLEEISVILSRLMQQLGIAEQYMIANEYLPKLNLQLATDLFIAKGLLGYLHKDINMDDHFERLLNDLTQLSLNLDDERLRQLAHHLLCSLVNKTESKTSNKTALSKTIVALKNAIKSGDQKAVEILAWIAKGLTVAGHSEAADIVESLANLLEHPSLNKAAILAFEIISAEYPELHLPVVKFLYKQKYFHIILGKLGHKLLSYCEHHLNAFIFVLKATPHKVLHMNINKVGPILFKCLESTNTYTLCIALGICENFVKEKDEYISSHLNHLIPSYLTLSRYKQSMQVRISALNLLYDITKYPTYVLLPHKMDVVLGLAVTLDDHKRLVRNAAVKARNAWYLLGSQIADE